MDDDLLIKQGRSYSTVFEATSMSGSPTQARYMGEVLFIEYHNKWALNRVCTPGANGKRQ
jgi:hypothetical protein